MKKVVNMKRSIGYGLGKAIPAVAVVLFAVLGIAFAASLSIGSAASNVTTSMAEVAKLITAGAYVAGFGFAVGAILKFKAHKDNPQQVPVGTPIALIFIAAALIFLPSIMGMAEQTIFAGSATAGSVTGVTSFS